MNEISRIQKRPMHVILGFIGPGVSNIPLVDTFQHLASDHRWVFSWREGLGSLLQIFSADHPDLVVLVADALGEQEQALIRYLRTQEKTRRVGLVVMTKLNIMDSEETSHRVARSIESGADEVLDQNLNPVELRARIRSVLRQKIMFDELRRTNHHLKVLSLTDDLTGLANMRHFTHRIEREWTHVQSGLQSLAIVMIDIDFFKNINDSSNHLVGSELLAQFGGLLKAHVQNHQGELAARYGGDEFILMLKMSSFSEVMQRIEDLRKAIALHVFSSQGHEFRLTVSIGVAGIPAGYQGQSTEAIKVADLQLYVSKKQGRNQLSGKNLGESVPSEHGTRMMQRTKVLERLPGLSVRS